MVAFFPPLRRKRNRKLKTQFVNLFLFFVGVALVIAAVLLTMFTYPLKARWDAFANISLMVSPYGKNTRPSEWGRFGGQLLRGSAC